MSFQSRMRVYYLCSKVSHYSAANMMNRIWKKDTSILFWISSTNAHSHYCSSSTLRWGIMTPVVLARCNTHSSHKLLQYLLSLCVFSGTAFYITSVICLWETRLAKFLVALDGCFCLILTLLLMSSLLTSICRLSLFNSSKALLKIWSSSLSL